MAGKVLDKKNIFGGAARMVFADSGTSKPTKILDVFDGSWDLQTGWNDVGATDGGLSMTRGYDKEEWEVDQVLGPIDEFLTKWNMSLTTSIAENSLTNLNLAMELGAQTTDAAENPDETTAGIGAPDEVTEFMGGFLVDKRNGGATDNYDYKRLYIFWRMKFDGSDIEQSWNKGEKVLIPVTFSIYTDTTEASTDTYFGKIIDQVYGTYS